jgi:hypothetical protein
MCGTEQESGWNLRSREMVFNERWRGLKATWRSRVFAQEMNQSQKLLLKTWANQMVWFDKPDCPVLSGLTAVRDAIELRRGAPPPAKRRLDGGEA